MLKRITAIALCLILTASFTGCKSGLNNKDNGQNGSSVGNADNGQSGSKKEEAKFDYTDPSIYTIDAMVSMGIEEPKTADAEIEKAADAKLKKIMDNPDTLKPKEGGKYIYVGNGGTDGKGYGLEPDKPFETIEYAGLVAKAGDVVLLRRGDFWRTQVYIKEGVSYGAYGKGNKPTIYGSTRDVASQDWEKVNKNIYKTQSGTGSDIGLLVFNHGKATGSKKRWEQELEKDFDFYCSGGYIYLYYSKGNPKNKFKSVEVCPTQSIVKMPSNSTIQNWRVMYGGAHGISMSHAQNVTIDGCVIGYIGGGFQANSVWGPHTRYGNGIEVWGECDGYTVTNCHVFQCYDTGITMQYETNKEEDVYIKNVLFKDNLLEYNNYNIEYFLKANNETNSKMQNILIQNNILRYGGFGWGFHSRPDRSYGTCVMSFPITEMENFVYKNNIFDRGSCMILIMIADKKGNFPKFMGNTYAQTEKKSVLEKQGQPFNFKRDGDKVVTEIIGDKTGKIIKY